ncbi:MAG TPA: hypothetical protein VMU84_00210 [Thermoanaerobaculia bacterium]|nr:hypothetical protein [Thermoanaerobaculia bacterium]
MSTNPRHMENLWPDYSFATIDKGIADLKARHSVEAKALPTAAAPTTAAPEERTARLLSIYAAVRPIFAVLTAVPLIPPTWRDALRLFVVMFDETAALSDIGPRFKAGKDL